MLNKRNELTQNRIRLSWSSFERWVRGRKLPLFTPQDVMGGLGVTQTAATFFLHRHAKKGDLLRVRPGLYALADKPPLDFYLANKLYEPSYISLETSLSFHGIIPETVYTVTSVTTRKTKDFEVNGILFSYHQIKKRAFTGYGPHSYFDTTIFIAEPEKALADYLYLKLKGGEKASDILARIFERPRKERLDKEKSLKYARLFGDKRIVSFLKENLP